MNRKISLGITIGLIALAIAATFIVTYNYSLGVFNEKVSDVSEREGVYSRLAEIDQYIRANYLDEINEDVVMDGILQGYVESIDDKYAKYYTAKEYSDFLDKDEGVIVGLGINHIEESSGYIRVAEVIYGGPAYEAGIKAGDIITAVNNTDVIAYEDGYSEAAGLLSCDIGTKVKLHIRRINELGYSEFFSIDLVGEAIEIVSVKGRLIEENVGYILIETFNDKTADQFRDILDELISGGATSLVLDVRDNLGGAISALEEVLDCIIGSGEIVTAHFKDKTEVVVTTTEAEKINMPIVVLVNKKTASSSELFALALREKAGAILVGTQTFGKGVMQYTHKLSSGAAVKLTVATLQTEASGDYNDVGVKPDYELEFTENLEFQNLSAEDALVYDNQLVKALEVVQTRNK